MVKMKCPVCGCVTSVPEGRTGVCCFCNYELSAPAALPQMPFAEPVPRPKISLEKAPRVNLGKELPAASAGTLPQPVRKASQEDPLPLTETSPEMRDAASRQIKRYHLVNAALYAAQYCLCQIVGRTMADQSGISQLSGISALGFWLVCLSFGLVPIYVALKFPREAYERLGWKNITATETFLWILRLGLYGFFTVYCLFHH